MKRIDPLTLYNAATKQISEEKVILASVCSHNKTLRLNWYPGYLSFGVELNGEEERMPDLLAAVNDFCFKQ